MTTLIVQGREDLGRIWQRHLARLGLASDLVGSESAAIKAVRDKSFAVIVLDLDLSPGNALTVADYAGYRQPAARILFVTNRTFFSDGSLLRQYGNACGLLQHGTPPEDLAVMVDHYRQLA